MSREMSVISATSSEIHSNRYDALLRLGKALANCNDCETAKTTMVRELSEVTPFDYLHIIAFVNTGDTVCWQLIQAHGRRREDLEVVLGNPSAWLTHNSQYALVTPDWREETRF